MYTAAAFQKSERLDDTNIQSVQIPSSITYYVQNAFPINIIAAPLAYGSAQLIKTSIVFKFDNFFVDRTSRVGDVLSISDQPWKNTRDANINRRPTLLSTTLKAVSQDTSQASTKNDSSTEVVDEVRKQTEGGKYDFTTM